LLLEISSRRRRQTTYGLVGKRLLLVYAQPSGAAAKRIGKNRSRPIKDDKRRDRVRIVLANDGISTSLTSGTAGCGPPRNLENHGEKTAIRVGVLASAAACRAAVPILHRGRTVRLFTGPLFPCIDPPSSGASGGRLSSRASPDTETDMNDFGTRAGGEAPEFGPGGIGPVLSELGAVVAASVVLGLAFLILS
jgi:hypothetical protein